MALMIVRPVLLLVVIDPLAVLPGLVATATTCDVYQLLVGVVALSLMMQPTPVGHASWLSKRMLECWLVIAAGQQSCR